MRNMMDIINHNRRVEAEARNEPDKGGSVPQMAAPTPAAGEWTQVPGTAFTATPASTSRITMSDTSMLAVGMQLKYTIATVDYYGLVNAISADAYIDVMGAPLGGDVTALYASDQKGLSFQMFFQGANFASTSSDLLDTVMNAATGYPATVGHLVGFRCKLKTPDSTAGPKINIVLAGNAVSNNDSGHGIQATASWVKNPLVAIDATKYTAQFQDALTARCTVAAGTGNAANLSVDLHFVME